ncbi:hypothetical protein [Pseudomonas sp. QD4]|uniref:hypothetical protein n=1 Tax=Pseudomonas sp. QD4 TaxID=3368618 RepID=UPI003BA02C21
MTVFLEKLPPAHRQEIQRLMNNNGWSLERALNELVEASIAAGALSAVGKKKAQVLHLVTPMRASGRDSSG